MMEDWRKKLGAGIVVDEEGNAHPIAPGSVEFITDPEGNLAANMTVDPKAVWARARWMGGGTLMTFSTHVTREECEAECKRRKEELQTKVDFFPVYLPMGVAE